VTIDANTNGSGRATLSFKPPLLTSPTDDAAITVDNPISEMMLTDDRQGIREADENGVYESKTFGAVQVI
jgi:hypothetical protein